MSKTFIITGASTGIGNATAKILLKKRYKVIGLSRKKSIFHKNYKHIFLMQA